MRKIVIAAVISTLIVATIGLSSLGNAWVVGTFWKWEGTSVQSPSVTSATTIYVLTSTTVLDAQVFVLGQVNQIEDRTFVTLGEAMREPNYPVQAFDVAFQLNTEWRLNPPGWESEESSTWPSGSNVGSRTVIRKVETNEASVSVPAGEYAHCSKLTVSEHVAHPETVFERDETIWYCHDIDWPVKIIYKGTFQGKTYTSSTVLIQTGRIDPSDAAAQILAAIDKMEVQQGVPAPAVSTVRWKLLSLGLLKQP